MNHQVLTLGPNDNVVGDDLSLSLALSLLLFVSVCIRIQPLN